MRVSQMRFVYRPGRGDHHVTIVNAGKPTVNRYGYDGHPIEDYPVNVEVTESPKGKSVWVYVNGQRVWPPEDT